MGKALNLLTGNVTAPGATLTDLVMAAGDTLTIQNTAENSAISLLAAWAKTQAAGALRIRSPKMHDNVEGWHVPTATNQNIPLWPIGGKQRLFEQDTLTVQAAGSAVGGDIEVVSLLVGYDDLNGVDGRFLTKEEYLARSKNILAIFQTVVAGVVGGYSGEESIDTDFDLLKANTDYALLGFTTNVIVGSIGLRGPDTGNTRLGAPGNMVNNDILANWFVNLSQMFNDAWIPVFNSANKSATFIDVANDENALSPTIGIILAELDK